MYMEMYVTDAHLGDEASVESVRCAHTGVMMLNVQYW